MKLSQLKTNEVRKKLEFFTGSEVESVTIYNPIGETRIELIKLLTAGEDKDGKIITDEEELGTLIYELMFDKCTDLEIEEEVELAEIIENPNEITSKILMELNEIISELQTQSLVEKIMQVNAIEKTLLGVALNLKNQKIADEIDRLIKMDESIVKSLKEILDMAQTLKVNVELNEAEKAIEETVKTAKEKSKKPKKTKK